MFYYDFNMMLDDFMLISFLSLQTEDVERHCIFCALSFKTS